MEIGEDEISENDMTAQLEDLVVLQSAEKISDLLWKQVVRWDAFMRETVGLQMVRAADSIGANTAEAFGRFHSSNLQSLISNNENR